MAYTYFPQLCHNPCYLRDVPKEVIGDQKLIKCAAMKGNGSLCKECGCSYEMHQHVYYETTEVPDKKIDCNVETEVKTTEQAKLKAKGLMERMEDEISHLEATKQDLTKAMAKFAHFLKANALVSVNDAIEKYIEQMIKNQETSLARSGGNQHIVEQLKLDLARYVEEKALLDRVSQDFPEVANQITSQAIFLVIDELKLLKIPGINFDEILKKAQVVDCYNRLASEVVYDVKLGKVQKRSNLKTKLQSLFKK